MTIKTSGYTDCLAALILAQKLGATFREDLDDPHSSPEAYAAEFGETCPVLNFNDHKRFTGGNSKTYGAREVLNYPEDTTKIVEYFTGVKIKKQVSIQGVGEYSAKVSAKGVEVGCQIISFEKVEEIYKAIQDFKRD